MESKTGNLWLIDGQRRYKLKVFVYGDSPDPFVVFYQESKWIWNKPCAFLRLKDAIVEDCGEVTFTVVPKGERLNQGPTHLTFSAESTLEKKAWLETLRCSTDNEWTRKEHSHGRKISRTRPCSLPSIQESDEAEQRRPNIILAWTREQRTGVEKRKLMGERAWKSNVLWGTSCPAVCQWKMTVFVHRRMKSIEKFFADCHNLR